MSTLTPAFAKHARQALDEAIKTLNARRYTFVAIELLGALDALGTDEATFAVTTGNPNDYAVIAEDEVVAALSGLSLEDTWHVYHANVTDYLNYDPETETEVFRFSRSELEEHIFAAYPNYPSLEG